MSGCRAYTRRGFNVQHQSLEEDGRYIYVGNFLDSDISILRVDGDQIVNTGKSLALARPSRVDARAHALSEARRKGRNAPAHPARPSHVSPADAISTIPAVSEHVFS